MEAQLAQVHVWLYRQGIKGWRLKAILASNSLIGPLAKGLLQLMLRTPKSPQPKDRPLAKFLYWNTLPPQFSLGQIILNIRATWSLLTLDNISYWFVYFPSIGWIVIIKIIIINYKHVWMQNWT